MLYSSLTLQLLVFPSTSMALLFGLSFFFAGSSLLRWLSLVVVCGVQASRGVGLSYCGTWAVGVSRASGIVAPRPWGTSFRSGGARA